MARRKSASSLCAKQATGMAGYQHLKGYWADRATRTVAQRLHARPHLTELLEQRVFLAAHIVGSAAVYPTIQAAVDAAAPSSVITVDSGVYSELVTVGKSLTIRGAQAGVDARTNSRQAGTNESVVNGSTGGSGQSTGFYIISNDVTIDGFTVQGNTSTSVYGAGIVIAPGKSGTHILDNIVQTNVSGLFLANSSATDPAIIQYNVFAANNNAGDNGGRGIYSDGSLSGGVLTNVTIDSNFFIHNHGGSGSSGFEAAIAFQAGSSVQSNIRITNNTMDGNGKALLAYNASNLTIQNNTITDSADVDSGALRFEGGVSNVLIESNNIYNNSSPAIRIDSKVTGTASSGFTINYNNIYGNGYVDIASPPAGIQPGSVLVASSTYTGSFNIQNNWWGSSNGPSGDYAGSGDVVRANGASVTYQPFNTSPVVAQQSSFTGKPQVPDNQIQAVTFDQGGLNVGYLVGTAVNATMPYRATGVTTQTTADSGSAYDVPYNVAGMAAGQWLAYSVVIPVSGTYRLDFRIATVASGGTFHATIDGTTVGGSQSVPNTGGAQTWQTISSGNFTATAGQHSLKILFDTNGSGGATVNVHWLKLVTVTPNSVAPTAPLNLVAIPVTSSQVDLTWSNTAVNQTGFTVERSTDGINFTPLATLTATTTAYADPGLAPSRSYFYRVEATNGVGASPASNVATVITPVPPSVTQLSDISWVSATTGFGTIHLDQSINGNPVTLRGVIYPRGIGTHAISQIVYNLGGAYSAFTSDIGVDDEANGQGSITFQVLGDNNAVLYSSPVLTKSSAVVHVSVSVAGVQQLTLLVGDGGDGNANDHADWAGPVLIQGAPAAPTGLQALSAPNQINLTWNASPGATTYNVYRGTTPGGESATAMATNVSVTSYSDPGLTPGVTYYYNVAAVNAGGTSTRSNETSAAPTNSQAPAAPTGVQGIPGIGQVSLTWPIVAGAASYKIYRGTSPGGESATAYASNLSTGSFVDASVTASVAYYYKVSAVNAFGEGLKSAEVSVSTLQAPAHIVIVVEENKDDDDIVGFPPASYLNSLIQQGAYFSTFHAVTHPSQPNYIALFSGSTQGVTDDTVPASQFNAPNLANQLLSAGLTFTGYSEDLPSVGSLAETGGPLDSVGVPSYARKHNPWSDFVNVPSNLNQPFTAFPTNYDLLPTVSFVIPNLDNDMHDSNVATGDAWLQNNLGAYVTWAKTHNSLLVVTWDENDTGDSNNIIPTFIVGQQIQAGTYAENTSHYGVLRTIEDMYGLPSLGGAASATAIQDIWKSTSQGPAAPTNLVPTPAVSQITLDWTASSGATSYNVYRGTTPGGEGGTPIATGLGTTHFVDTPLPPGTTYYYQVTAVNSSGESGRSAEITTATLKASPAFSGLTASSSLTYGSATTTLSGTIAAGSLIPNGNVVITINGVPTNAAINASTGAFSASVDTHLLAASATAYTVTYSYTATSGYNAASDANHTLTIAKRSLNVTATGVNRPYDGTTAATVSLLDNRVNSDAITLNYGSAVFLDKTAATGKTVNVSSITLSGTAAANYTLANTTTSTTANITQRSLTVTAVGSNKVYDTTTAATVTLSDNRVAGDTLTVSKTSATFPAKTVGTSLTITVAGLSISGTDAANYTLTGTTASTTANITALSITGSITASSKVYTATTAATIATRSLTGVLSGDTVTLTGGAATFDTKNIGTGKTVTATGLSLTGTDAANYTLASSTVTTTANVTVATLTGNITASNKVYDSTTAASLATRTLTGVLLTDVVTLTGGTATFDTKNVGTGKTVTATGLSLTGTDSANYTLASTTATTTANITVASLTGSVTASNKVYDATTASTLATRTLTGVLGSDAVTLTGGTATFSTKIAGTGKTVTATGLTLTGADAPNYVLGSSTATTTANITAATLTPGITASNKVYDSTMIASLAIRTLTGVLLTDVVTLTGGTAAFDTKNIGTSKTVTATGLILAGADAANYSLSSSSATTTANITVASVTGSVTASNKVYDSTTAATLATRLLTGVFGSDAVTLTGGTATFDTKNIGTGKTVTATGLSLTGTDAANYTLASSSATATANITVASISGTITANSKTYDATTTAAIATRNLTGILGTDVVTLTGGSATFDTKNVGTGKTVTATGLSLTGVDAANYSLTNPTETTTANVTVASVSGTITASSKTYDTTTAATIATRNLAGVLGTDAVTLTGGTATFDTKNIGTGKTVTATGLALSGADAANYTLSNSTETATANITAASVTGSITASSKTYDGTTVAALSARNLTGVLGTEVVSLTGGTATFDTKNIGIGKTVTATGLTLTGADVGNYTLSNSTATTTTNITAAPVTGTVTVSDKLYDATTAADLSSFSLSGVLGADSTKLTGGVATFDTKNVGSGKTVTVTALTLSGVDAGNYTLSNPVESTTADITAASLTGSITASDKLYDATTTASISARNLTGILGTDAVSLTGGNADFDSKNIGAGKTVTAAGFALSGADAFNYFLSNPTITTTASITPIALAGSITASDKVYDSTTTATLASGLLTGVIGSEVVTLNGSATFDTKNIGAGKTVTAAGLTLGGADAGNYTLNNPTETATANITAASLTGSISAASRVYNFTTLATLTARNLTGVLGTDSVSLTGGIATFDTKDVGTGKTVTATGLALSGADAGNYTLSNPTETTTADISAAPVIGSISASNKPYDGTTTAIFARGGLIGVFGSDIVSLVGGSASFDTKNIGNGKIVTATGLAISGPSVSNYVLSNPTETTTAAITPKTLILATSGTDDIRLSLDADLQDIDWAIFVSGFPQQVGQLSAADASGLTIIGAGGNDTIAFSYANGNPLPANLHLNGTFTLNGLANSNPLALANSTIEIGNSTIYISYTTGQSPATFIQQALAQGYNGGTWTGSATASVGSITSTNAATGPAAAYAVGYADSADGVVIGQPANTVELRFTNMGDANLDRVVNVNDLALLRANYNATNTPAWDRANFNFDSKVDGTDAIILGRNLNATASGAATAAIAPAPAVVPAASNTTTTTSNTTTNSSITTSSNAATVGLTPTVVPAPVITAPVATSPVTIAPTTSTQGTSSAATSVVAIAPVVVSANPPIAPASVPIASSIAPTPPVLSASPSTTAPIVVSNSTPPSTVTVTPPAPTTTPAPAASSHAITATIAPAFSPQSPTAASPSDSTSKRKVQTKPKHHNGR